MTKIITIDNKTFLQTDDAVVASCFLVEEVGIRRHENMLIDKSIKLLWAEKYNVGDTIYRQLYAYPIYIPIETVIEVIQNIDCAGTAVCVTNDGSYMDLSTAWKQVRDSEKYHEVYTKYNPILITITSGDCQLIKDITNYIKEGEK